MGNTVSFVGPNNLGPQVSPDEELLPLVEQYFVQPEELLPLVEQYFVQPELRDSSIECGACEEGLPCLSLENAHDSMKRIRVHIIMDVVFACFTTGTQPKYATCPQHHCIEACAHIHETRVCERYGCTECTDRAILKLYQFH
jgi:hypothetical protein